MGGPWKVAGFDPAAWRPPAPHHGVDGDSMESDGPEGHVAGIVIAYAASVVLSIAVMLIFMMKGG